MTKAPNTTAKTAKQIAEAGNPDAKTEDNRKNVDEAAKAKEPPATTEQPTEEEKPARDDNPIGLPAMPAHLEGQEDVKTPVKLELMPAYEQGRAAFRGGISKDDAPHGEGVALDAWKKGWNFEKKAAD